MRYLIIGDVHAEFEPFKKAVDFALDNDLHLISVGDLIDNGPDGFKVLSLFNSLVEDNKASLIRGNHEWKIYRWAIGRDVKITDPNRVTVDEMKWNTKFKDLIIKLTEGAPMFMQLSDTMYVAHAAIGKKFWVDGEVDDRMMFGYSDRTQTFPYRGEIYPIRVYDWVEDVPAGIKLFVGHDPRPMIGKPDFDNFQLAPLTVKNKQKGAVTFLDTGSGKGGTLWGAVVNSATSNVEQFRNFSI